MIIFTEHKEVIMSENDMRELFRLAYNSGWEDCINHPTIPATFRCEDVLRRVEKHTRVTQHLPTEL